MRRTISLSPLSDERPRTLIAVLLGQRSCPRRRSRCCWTAPAGNPLYAEEFVRALVEAGLTGAAALPDTIQGIIAARLTACRGRRSGSPEHAQVLAGDAELAHARLKRRPLQPQACGRPARAAEQAVGVAQGHG